MLLRANRARMGVMVLIPGKPTNLQSIAAPEAHGVGARKLDIFLGAQQDCSSLPHAGGATAA
jgi:hypothetical protein